jgi:hypothetical protein
MNPSLSSSPVTFTTTVTATAGTPTGSVAFFDESTQLGLGALSAGSASFTTSALAAGSHAITAVYSGDTNFATLTTAVLTQTVESFTIGIMAAGVCGCSSGGGSSGGSTPTSHAYPLTVTATSGSLTQSTTLTLTVD